MDTEIVEQADARETELDRDGFAIHGPRHVRQMRRIVEDRAGDTEACRLDPRFALGLSAQELANHRDEPVVLDRREGLYGNRRRPQGRAREQPQQRLRAPDISGQQHAGRL